mgnify:CR=1 FL=1
MSFKSVNLNAMGAGGMIGAGAVDVAKLISGSPFLAYASVFTGEALLFLAAALIAGRVAGMSAATSPISEEPRGASARQTFATLDHGSRS